MYCGKSLQKEANFPDHVNFFHTMQVNMQLKGAIEAQSLEIAKLQVKINSTVGTGYVRTPTETRKMLVDRSNQHESTPPSDKCYYGSRITGDGMWDGLPTVNCTRCEEHRSVVSILCERLESKSREVVEMLQERERGEHALLQARKELRQSRLRLMQVMQDLDKVTLQQPMQNLCE